MARDVAAVLILAILDGVEKAGMDADAIAGEIGVDRSAVHADDWLSQDVEEELWHILLQRGGAGIGIRAAEAWPRGAFGGVEFAVRKSPNLRVGLHRLVRFNRIISGRQSYELHSETEDAVVAYDPPMDPDTPEYREGVFFALVSLIRLSREVAGRWLVADDVARSMPAPSNALSDRMTAAVGAQVRWQADRNAITFCRPALDASSTETDPPLVEILDEYLEECLTVVPEGSTARALRGVLTETLADGETSLESAAKTLGMSERTLQTRLAEEGTTFREELEALRERLACQYLARPDITIAGVSLLLGYADATAFHRAFKRWTDQTPSGYRASRRSSGK